MEYALSMYRSVTNPCIWGLPLELNLDLPSSVLTLEYRYVIVCVDGGLLAESSGNSRKVVIDSDSLSDMTTREFEQEDVLLRPIHIGNLN